MLDYDAVAVGPFDLAGGINVLKESADNGFPWISANIYDRGGTLVFRPFISTQSAGLNIAFIGLTAAVSAKAEQFEITEGMSEIKTLIEELRPSHEVIVLLSTVSYKQAEEIANQEMSPDIIISGDRSKGNLTPVIQGKTMITQTTSQGRYLAKTSVDWRGSGWGGNYADKLANLQTGLKSINWQLNRLQAGGDSESKAVVSKISALQNEKERFSAEINKLEMQQAEQSSENLRNSFNHVFIPLNTSVKEDPEIQAVIEELIGN